MKKLVVYLAKKYALSAVKDAVKANKDNVAKYATVVRTWTSRVRMVLTFLQVLADRLADGVLTDAEIEQTVTDAEALAEEVTK